MILTKEVSRFARKMVDTLNYTRRLSELKVGVIFMNDGIDTRDKDGELRLMIMKHSNGNKNTADICRFGYILMILLDLVMDRVHENKRVNSIQRTVLPRSYFGCDFLNDLADQAVRNFHIIQILYMLRNIPLTHSTGVKRKNFLSIPSAFLLYFSIICGSYSPLRSRGILTSTSPSCVFTVFFEYPLPTRFRISKYLRFLCARPY